MISILKPVNSCSGYILLAVSLLLTAFMSIVLVCSFVAGHGSDNDFRYAKTGICIKKVRQALSGKKSDACRGFISDYGEPDVLTPFAPEDNFAGVLLNRQSVPTWQGWSHSGPPGEFWAGYRGDRYLAFFAGEWNDTPPFPHNFSDGWGNPVKVIFIQDTTPEYTVMEIKSFGSNGVSGGTGNYQEDVKDVFYWKRSVKLNLSLDAGSLGLPEGQNVDVEARLVYPFHGAVTSKNQTETLTITGGSGSSKYDFPINPPANMNPQKFPAGLRKIMFILKTDLGPWGGPAVDTLLADRIILIPSYPAASNPLKPPDSYIADEEIVI